MNSSDFKSVLPVAYIEAFLRHHRIRWQQIEDGDKVWLTKDGRRPLTVPDIERLISLSDPVIWAFMNLTERKGVQNPEGGGWYAKPGQPWKLFPVQAKLARLKGNVIAECGSEVGKTRDIVLGTLWEADTANGGDDNLIAADSEGTLGSIWEELTYQLEANPHIGGGVKNGRLKPHPFFELNNDFTIYGRICGHNGKQFRGLHITRTIRADEVTLWKNPTQFSELFRAGKPGCAFRLESTPDGDYSSPFSEMCARAVPYDAAPEIVKTENETDDVRFRKINIKKSDLPAPFWSEKRHQHFIELYGGEQDVRYQTNVNGAWGSPSYSVFPMYLLEPNLKGGISLPWYRLVVANVDHVSNEVSIVAASLDPVSDTEEGSNREQIIAREKFAVADAQSIATEIAKFFPPTGDWIDPQLYCGVDPGSADDPAEFLFVRKLGDRWQDVFRLHIRGASWPQQAELLAGVDHVSGHRARYSIDNGSAGAALIQTLAETQNYSACPKCREYVDWSERLDGRNFGSAIDMRDPETGEVLLNPDRKDSHSNPLPFRVNNKEYGTRILERKMQGRKLEIANDGGAGNQKLASAQLLVNHTEVGKNRQAGSSNRIFKGIDDHAVDARRQAALAIISWEFDGMRESPSAKNVRTAGPRESMQAFRQSPVAARGRVGSGLDGFGVASGSVRGGLFR